MKRTWKIAIIVVALLFAIALIPALIPDEEYTPGAREWLELAQKPPRLSRRCRTGITHWWDFTLPLTWT